MREVISQDGLLETLICPVCGEEGGSRAREVALPRLLHIRRHSPVEAVPASEVRYYPPLQDTLLVSWGLTRAVQREGDVPYIRKKADSRWGVRVSLVEQAGRAS